MSSKACRLNVHLDHVVGTISRNLYGHFAEHLGTCIYEGIWVGPESRIPNTAGYRNDTIEALRELAPPVLRWPGGCFADDYHWRDGVGPRDRRPRRINRHWGQVVETNEFGTDEFIGLCRLIGAEPYVCANVGSGTPAEMSDWIEYCNASADSTLATMRAENGSPEPHDVTYWGIGNENWGCGGSLDPEDYCGMFRRFSTFATGLGRTRPYRIACGPCGNDLDWTHRFLEKLGGRFGLIEGFAPHLYQGSAGTSLRFTDAEYYDLTSRFLGMERMICQQRAAMDGFDPDRRVGLVVDEWGVWHPDATPGFLKQQNTLRDAVAAAAILDVFNRHADKIVMANIAQTVNVLQSMILTDGEKFVLTPTYHVFRMYRPHQDAQLVFSELESDRVQAYPDKTDDPTLAPTLAGSASKQNRTVTITLVNRHLTEARIVDVRLIASESVSVKRASGTVLTAETPQAHNTFESPAAVEPADQAITVVGERFKHILPPCSVTRLQVDLD
ncbi:MAG: alpha-N-arabinofuranosidase [Phycisphaerae bacterium]|nr:alpha-N-arabinofuranosidase [Phycisphaerae bacterium]